MPETISLTINEKTICVPRGTMVSVAIVVAGEACRNSLTGEPRGPLCAMGICCECRTIINGTPHQFSCRILCQQGMDVRTQ